MSEKHIPANQVRELCGSVSDMTLWRWLANERLGFPKPKIINRRRYWRETDVVAWLNATSEQTAA